MSPRGKTFEVVSQEKFGKLFPSTHKRRVFRTTFSELFPPGHAQTKKAPAQIINKTRLVYTPGRTTLLWRGYKKHNISLTQTFLSSCQKDGGGATTPLKTKLFYAYSLLKRKARRPPLKNIVTLNHKQIYLTGNKQKNHPSL